MTWWTNPPFSEARPHGMAVFCSSSLEVIFGSVSDPEWDPQWEPEWVRKGTENGPNLGPQERKGEGRLGQEGKGEQKRGQERRGAERGGKETTQETFTRQHGRGDKRTAEEKGNRKGEERKMVAGRRARLSFRCTHLRLRKLALGAS